MSKLLAFCNQKGGVGKTTTVVNLGAALAEKGLRVLILDCDPQGNASSGVGCDKSSLGKTTYDLLSGNATVQEVARETKVTNLWIAPSNRNLAGAEVELIQQIRREFFLKDSLDDVSGYDYVFIDCPPSLGILTVNGLAASDGLIIPLQCEYYALEGLSELLKTVQLVRGKLNPKLEILGVVLTMADARTRLTGQVSEEVRKFLGDKVFQVVIPRSIRASEAPSFGEAVVTFDRNSRAAQAYLALAEEFLVREGRQGEREVAGQPVEANRGGVR